MQQVRLTYPLPLLPIRLTDLPWASSPRTQYQSRKDENLPRRHRPQLHLRWTPPSLPPSTNSRKEHRVEFLHPVGIWLVFRLWSKHGRVEG